MTDDVDVAPPRQAHGDNNAWPVLTIDYDFYEKMLEDSDASHEEKRAFIELWWNLIMNFVDLGFEIHPLQQACEQALDLSTLNLSDVLDSKGLPVNAKFNKTTQNDKGAV